MATLGGDTEYLLGRALRSPSAAAELADTVADALEPAADIAALTDSSGGATADKTIAVIPAFTPSVAWNGSSVFPSAADATAIEAANTANRNAIKELATQINLLRTNLRAAGLML